MIGERTWKGGCEGLWDTHFVTSNEITSTTQLAL